MGMLSSFGTTHHQHCGLSVCVHTSRSSIGGVTSVRFTNAAGTDDCDSHAFPTHFRGKACFHRSASGCRFRAVTRDYGPGYTCLCLSRAPVSKRTSRCVVLSIEHCTLSKNLLCVLPRTAAIKNNSDGSRGLEATRRKWLAFRARSSSVVLSCHYHKVPTQLKCSTVQ